MNDHITPDITASTPSARVTTELVVTGMTCSHCVASVTEEVSTLVGVDTVAVNLKPAGESIVSVRSTQALDPDAIRAAITEAGYDLVSVR
jgi:copper chaperone